MSKADSKSDRIKRLAALMELLESRPDSERKGLLTALRLVGRHAPSISNYYLLRRRWLAAGKNPESLKDGRAALPGGKPAPFSPEALAFFCRIYLRSNAPSREGAYIATMAEARTRGWQLPSIPTVRRALDRRVPVVIQEQLRAGLLLAEFPEGDAG